MYFPIQELVHLLHSALIRDKLYLNLNEYFSHKVGTYVYNMEIIFIIYFLVQYCIFGPLSSESCDNKID